MSHGLPVHKSGRCPACGREIYSRRRHACEFCGELLPVDLLLTDEERKAVDQEIREIKQRREAEMEAERLSRE